MEDTTDILNRENNQFLLNAIKNKFAVENSDGGVHFSPSKFIIPELKSIPESSSNCAKPVPNKVAPSKLNEFILGQLNTKQASTNEDATMGRFALPKLQMRSQNNGVQDGPTRFVIPLLNGTKSVESYQSIYKGNIPQSIKEHNGFKVQGKYAENDTFVIDLTTALSSSSMNSSNSLPSTSSRLELRTKALKVPAEEFEIPFIDCDRQDTFKKSLGRDLTNDYCTTDASDVQLSKIIKRKPSTFGRIVCSRYLFTCRFPHIEHGFKVKHNIPQFQFETSSPDDIILSKLRKHQRQHQT